MIQHPASTILPRMLIALLTLCQLAAADYYVAPQGDDGNAGTPQSLFATIQRARDMVCTQIAGGMTDDITAHLGPGNYFIETAVVFDDRDGGNNGHTITYQGAPNLQSRIYGGRRITGWTPLNSTQYAATVPDLQQHFTLYEYDQAANGGLFRNFAGETTGNWARIGTTLTNFHATFPSPVKWWCSASPRMCSSSRAARASSGSVISCSMVCT